MKTCTKCGVEKDEIEFHKSRKNISGLVYSCKSCVSAYNKNNLLSLRQAHARWRERNRQKCSRATQDYYKKNKEKVLGRNRKWQALNREYRKQYQRLLYHKHRDSRVDRQKSMIANLNDWYVIQLLEDDGISHEAITKDPELLNIKKLIIKIKRELCQRKKQSQQT